jgi:hypothetical protein
MSDVPESRNEEPKIKLLISGDVHGGKFYQFGWVEELPRLLKYGRLPETSYRDPTL